MISLGGSKADTLRTSSVIEPPLPIEEDLAKASAWDDEDTSTLVSSKWKGKGKQRDHDDDDDDDRTVDGDRIQPDTGEYPPIAEEELESRKIEQNLKRWETLEKQRRKKLRDSRATTLSEPVSSRPSSFSVSDVGRRATQIWNGRIKSRMDRTHPHKVLEDADESLPMTEAGPPYASSPTDTPRNSTSDTLHTPPPPPRPSSDNPFDNPTYTERGTEPDTLMTAPSPGSLPPTPKASANGNSASERPILQVQGSSYVRHPPAPKRLDLPTPTSPPSQPANSLSSQQQEAEMEDGGNERRWWTEWLCGCREDGDNQAGRTNPME